VTDDSAGAIPNLHIVGGNPTPAEVAAVTAVLTGVLEELREQDDADGARPPSAWQRTQKPIRTALHPGAGKWRGFSG
jgi:hypothetical protein